MDDDIKGAFRDAADRLTTPRPALEEVVRGGRRLKWRHRVLASVSVMTVSLVAIPFIGVLSSDRKEFSAGEPNLEIARISVGHYPTAVAFGHDAAWVINWTGALQRIDPSTNKVVASIPILGEREEGAGKPAEDGSGESDTLPPEPGRQFGTVATGEGGVWVTADSRRGCSLYKVDPAQNQISASTQVAGCYPILAAAGSVWLGVGRDDAEDDYLLRLNPMTLEVQDRVTVGACCMSGITYENGFIWVGQQDVGNRVISEEGDKYVLPMRLAVLKVDPATNRVIGSSPLGGDLYRPGDTLLSLTMTSTTDGIWLTRPEAGYADRIDLSSGSIDQSVKVDDFRLPDDPQLIGGYVSVTELNGSRIAFLDPNSNQVVEVFDTGGAIAQWGASGAGSLWVAHPASDEVLRLVIPHRGLPSPSPVPSETSAGLRDGLLIDLQKEGPLGGGEKVTLDEAMHRTPYGLAIPPTNEITGELSGIWMSRGGCEGSECSSPQVGFVWATDMRFYVGVSDATEEVVNRQWERKATKEKDSVLLTVRGHTAIGHHRDENGPSGLTWMEQGLSLQFVSPNHTLKELKRFAEAVTYEQ